MQYEIDAPANDIIAMNLTISAELPGDDEEDDDDDEDDDDEVIEAEIVDADRQLAAV